MREIIFQADTLQIRLWVVGHHYWRQTVWDAILPDLISTPCLIG